MPKELYEKFLKIWKQVALLEHTVDLLSWDQETYMPVGENKTRAEQMAMFADAIHSKITDDFLYNTLLELEAGLAGNGDNNIFDNYQSANIREALKIVKSTRALPSDLVAAIAKETSLASEIWKKAREKSLFSDFAPTLAKIISLCREKAAAYMAAGIGSNPYEALFLEFENGISISEVDAIFDKLRAELPPLIKTVMSLEPPDDSFLTKYYPKVLQEKISREIITAIGLDFNRCRLDVSTHPFTCSPAYGSPRITSRYDENNLMYALFSAIHEAGHALYEQGLPDNWAYQPIGVACGLSVHESQSRFWEAWLGRSYPFWTVFYPKLKESFPENLNGVTTTDFYRAINRVKPEFIRTDSDNLTYDLHILLRYDIEKMMINDNISVTELPAVWNELFKKYFDITLPSDKLGILQDVHWSDGAIGYFPTYTLGNIISSQLYQKIRNDVPWSSIWDDDGSGNCRDFHKWLLEKVHNYGCLYKTQELVKLATGQPISADIFIYELKKRYSDVYNIDLS